MADEDRFAIKLDDETYYVDEFPLGDLEWLEEYIGASLNDRAAMGSMKAAVAFVYLIKKQKNPQFTLDDARAVKMSAFGDPDEEPAKPQRPTRARAKAA